MRTAFALKICATSVILFSLLACSSSIPRKTPGIQNFPDIKAESLSGDSVSLPDDLKGAPAIILVGYAQNAQFDIDRWILGLKQLGSSIKLLELPTIKGIMPGMVASLITNGMKRGIPNEDWSSVVTVFSDAEKLVDITGNENPNNARIFLLDSNGKIIWFYDRGYSADRVTELFEIAKKL